jgi:transcriptional regulator
VTSDPLLGERDVRILELNQQGLSAAQISKALKSEGIELSKRTVLRHLTELRQDRDNNVRVNFKYKSRKPKS